MAEDLYTKWLGLPPGPRPPKPHTILGVGAKVRDRAAIDRAAATQMDRLDQYVLSGDPQVREEVQQLMNHVARARTQLVDALPAVPEQRPPVAIPVAKPVQRQAATPQRSSKSSRSSSRKRDKPGNAKRTTADAAMPPAAMWVLLFFGWVVSIILTAFITSIIVSSDSPATGNERAIAFNDNPDPTQPPSIAPEPEPDPDVRPEPEIEPETELEPQPEPEPEPEIEPEPKPAFDPLATVSDPNLRAFIQERDRLEPAAQVELIRQKLSELNPSIEIYLYHEEDVDGKIYSLTVGRYNLNTNIKDLSPLTGLPLTQLSLIRVQWAGTLEPLRSMPLRHLEVVSCSGDTDLSPLAGMKIETIDLRGTPITDITPLASMALDEINLRGTSVTDITPLAGLDLATLSLSGTPVADLTPLRGMSISDLSVFGCSELRSLDGLEGMTFESLNCGLAIKLEDFSALSQVEVQDYLGLNRTLLSSLEPLDGLKTESLNLDGCVRLTSLEGLDQITNLRKVWLRSMGMLADELEQKLDLNGARRRYPDIEFISR